MRSMLALRVILAASIGSALEWYDFFLYGTAAALVFGELFFPKSDPLVGTLLSFLTFGVGFVVRPLGGILFGIMGDRYGRKPVLVATLLMIGAGTTVIGLLPTYAKVGYWAPIMLVALRVLQGLGAGAEYGGAVIYLVENAPADIAASGAALRRSASRSATCSPPAPSRSSRCCRATSSWRGAGGCRSSRVSCLSSSASSSGCGSPRRRCSPRAWWRAARSSATRRWRHCAAIRATSWSCSARAWRRTGSAICFRCSA